MLEGSRGAGPLPARPCPASWGASEVGDKWGAPQPRSEERREESTPPPLAPRSRPRPPLARTPLTPAPRSSCPRSAPVWGAGKRPRRARACSRRTCLAFCPEARAGLPRRTMPRSPHLPPHLSLKLCLHQLAWARLAHLGHSPAIPFLQPRPRRSPSFSAWTLEDAGTSHLPSPAFDFATQAYWDIYKDALRVEEGWWEEGEGRLPTLLCELRTRS